MRFEWGWGKEWDERMSVVRGRREWEENGWVWRNWQPIKGDMRKGGEGEDGGGRKGGSKVQGKGEGERKRGGLGDSEADSEGWSGQDVGESREDGMRREEGEGERETEREVDRERGRQIGRERERKRARRPGFMNLK